MENKISLEKNYNTVFEVLSKMVKQVRTLFFFSLKGMKGGNTLTILWKEVSESKAKSY